MDSQSQIKIAEMRPLRSKESSGGNAGAALALKVLAMLAEALPRANSREPFSPEALEFMAAGLADLPADALERAAARARDTSTFMPTVAELRTLAGCDDATAAQQGRAEELAAWESARQWLRRNAWFMHNPATGGHDWPDARQADRVRGSLTPRTEAAVRQIGGADAILADIGGPSEHWVRDRFCEAYRLQPEIETAALAMGGAQVQALTARLAKALTMGVPNGR